MAKSTLTLNCNRRVAQQDANISAYTQYQRERRNSEKWDTTIGAATVQHRGETDLFQIHVASRVEWLLTDSKGSRRIATAPEQLIRLTERTAPLTTKYPCSWEQTTAGIRSVSLCKRSLCSSTCLMKKKLPQVSPRGLELRTDLRLCEEIAHTCGWWMIAMRLLLSLPHRRCRSQGTGAECLELHRFCLVPDLSLRLRSASYTCVTNKQNYWVMIHSASTLWVVIPQGWQKHLWLRWISLAWHLACVSLYTLSELIALPEFNMRNMDMNSWCLHGSSCSFKSVLPSLPDASSCIVKT